MPITVYIHALVCSDVGRVASGVFLMRIAHVLLSSAPMFAPDDEAIWEDPSMERPCRRELSGYNNPRVALLRSQARYNVLKLSVP